MAQSTISLPTTEQEQRARWDLLLLAWTAGFFEGEGTIRYHGRALRFSIPQKTTVTGPADTLIACQNALGGLGRILPGSSNGYGHGPVRKTRSHVYCLHKFEHVQHAICLLWPYLHETKKRQAEVAIKSYVSAYRERQKLRAGKNSERSRSRALGLKRYSTGVPCLKGHVAERFTSNGWCIECAKRAAISGT